MFASAALRAVRRPIQLVTTASQCASVVERLLSSGHRAVAVDCEGPRLGRFGRLSLVQLAAGDEIFLVDVAAGGQAIVDPLTTLLESREVVKVFHDCREDVSLLTNQYGVEVTAVFDTQVAHCLWLDRQGLDLYQASLPEVMRTFLLSAYRKHRWDELEAKPVVPTRWQERPLAPQALRYAVEGVAHLVALQRVFCRELGDPAGDLVIQRSVRYVQYARLNAAELPSADLSGLRPGAPICAMLVSRRPDAAFFKLNHSSLSGAVLDPKELRDFKDLQIGDVAVCQVKSLSDCQTVLHLQRQGHGDLRFCDRTREMRKLPSLTDVDRAFPPRQSSMYGFGQPSSGQPGVALDRPSFKEEKPEVIFKMGGRGAVKIRKTGFRPPKPKGDRGE